MSEFEKEVNKKMDEWMKKKRKVDERMNKKIRLKKLNKK